jgi:hypothetical protein
MKEILGTDGQYFVSESGQVYSVKSRDFLKNQLNNKGYVHVGMCVSGKKYRQLVHRLVATAYIEKPDGCDVVNHLDNNPLNNHVSNLEWITQSGNLKHAGKRNTMARADKTVLTEAQVTEIWSLYPRPRQETADKFGVCLGTIRAIYDGLNWKHLYQEHSHIKTGYTEKVDGLKQGGEQNACAKLTAKQVISILEDYKHLPQTAVAELFGISKSSVGNIRTGKSWCEVTWFLVTPVKWPRGIPTPPNVDTSTWGFS